MNDVRSGARGGSSSSSFVEEAEQQKRKLLERARQQARFQAPSRPLGGGAREGPSSYQHSSSRRGAPALPPSATELDLVPSTSSEASLVAFPTAGDIAVGELRHSTVRLLHQFGFTHGAEASIDLLSGIAVRYMKSMAERVADASRNAGRSKAYIADLESVFEMLRIDVDEMNDYMKQNRAMRAREVPLFPVRVQEHLKVGEVDEPISPKRASGGLLPPWFPPVSALWLVERGESAEMGEEEGGIRGKEEGEGRGESRTDRLKCLCSRFSSALSAETLTPSFDSHTASALHLSSSALPLRRKYEIRPPPSKRPKPPPPEKGAARSKARRVASAAAAAEQRAKKTERGGAVAGFNHTHVDPLLFSEALRNVATVPSVPDTVPQAGGLATVPEEGGTGVRRREEVATTSREKEERGNGREEEGMTNEQAEHDDVVFEEEVHEHPPPAVPSPPPALDEATLFGALPSDASPARVMQLAVLRSIFGKDRETASEIKAAFAHIHGVRTTAATATIAEEVAVEETPPPPRPAVFTAPLRLKINIAPPPEEEIAEPSPSSGGTAREEDVASPMEVAENVDGTRSKKKKKHKKHKRERREKEANGEESSAAVESGPLPPLRLKIKLGPRPTVE